MSGDAYHITQPAEDGDGGYRVMVNAMRDAKITPEQVGYVNAHGTSTPIGDSLETIAIKRAFGEHARKMPVSSTKSMTGHLLGGAGGLEAGITVLALRDQILPPTINYEHPDPECDLDYVPNTRAQGGCGSCAKQFVRLRRNQRLPGVPALDGIAKNRPRINTDGHGSRTAKIREYPRNPWLVFS